MSDTPPTAGSLEYERSSETLQLSEMEINNMIYVIFKGESMSNRLVQSFISDVTGFLSRYRYKLICPSENYRCKKKYGYGKPSWAVLRSISMWLFGFPRIEWEIFCLIELNHVLLWVRRQYSWNTYRRVGFYSVLIRLDKHENPAVGIPNASYHH